MLNELIGIIHILFSLIISLYFVWRNDNMDIFYIIYFVILNLSWLLMKNECLISYLFKISKSSDYTLGDSASIEDYEIILGNKVSEIFLDYIRFMYLFNMTYIIIVSEIDYILKIFLAFFTLSCFLYMHSFKSDSANINTNNKNKEIIRNVHIGLTLLNLIYIAKIYLITNPHVCL